MTYTAGEIKKFFYVPEIYYGTTPTTALTWGGEASSFKPSTDFHPAFHETSGSRSFGEHTRDATDVGFNVKCLARAVSGGYNWTNLWAVYTFGSTTALTEHLGSFTAQTGKLVGSSHYYDFYNGCKINSLTINADAPGKPFIFDADVFCRYVTQKTSKTLTGLQSVTVGSDPSDITTAILTWKGILQINIAGGGLVNWYPRSWKLTVDNHLGREEGNILGADSVKYSLSAYQLSEGVRDIIFEATLPAQNETYTAAKIADSAVTSLTLPIDAKTITLTGGVWQANDFPEFKHDLNEETVRIRFKSLTIA